MFLTWIHFIFIIINSRVNWQQVVFQTFILLQKKVLLVCFLGPFLNCLKLLHFLVVMIRLNTLKVMMVALIRLWNELVLVGFIVPVFIIEIRIYIQLVPVLFHLLLLSWLLLLLQLASYYLVLSVSKCQILLQLLLLLLFK
jgi:hypothetical protein